MEPNNFEVWRNEHGRPAIMLYRETAPVVTVISKLVASKTGAGLRRRRVRLSETIPPRVFLVGRLDPDPADIDLENDPLATHKQRMQNVEGNNNRQIGMIEMFVSDFDRRWKPMYKNAVLEEPYNAACAAQAWLDMVLRESFSNAAWRVMHEIITPTVARRGTAPAAGPVIKPRGSGT